MPGYTEVVADVVVVGAGPTGLLTALLLAERGHSVALVEMWPEPRPVPPPAAGHDTLREALDRLVPVQPGLTVLRGWEVIRVSGKDDGAVAEALPFPGDTPSSASLRVTGRYVVGCDGATSMVRDVVSLDAVDILDGETVAVRRAGRVLVAGDAAHSAPSPGATGLYRSVRDAAVVSWQLDRVVRGLAGPELFDTDMRIPADGPGPADMIPHLLDRLRAIP